MFRLFCGLLLAAVLVAAWGINAKNDDPELGKCEWVVHHQDDASTEEMNQCAEVFKRHTQRLREEGERAQAKYNQAKRDFDRAVEKFEKAYGL
jgi:hypothetical protein